MVPCCLLYCVGTLLSPVVLCSYGMSQREYIQMHLLVQCICAECGPCMWTPLPGVVEHDRVHFRTPM